MNEQEWRMIGWLFFKECKWNARFFTHHLHHHHRHHHHRRHHLQLGKKINIKIVGIVSK